MLCPRQAPLEHVLLENVSWDYYEQTLHELDETHIHATYDQGRMEIMTLGDRHEIAKKNIARLLEIYAYEKRIPLTGAGSVTCRRKDLKRGVEPDECYYVHTPPPAGTDIQLNLSVYGPPDLVIEVDVTSLSIPRRPIYAALGVAELWHFDGEHLTSLHLQADSTYKPAERSVAFPELPMEQMLRFLRLAYEESQDAAVRALGEWIRAGS